MSLRQLSILSRYPQFAEEVLLAQGAHSVSLVDAADDPVLEPAPGTTPLWPRTRVIGLLDDGSVAGAIVALRATLPDGEQAVMTTAELPDEDWVRIWLRDWKPLRFDPPRGARGRRLWVCPRAQVVRERGAVTVLLDPGLAFGTGTHPSTALCLRWLAGTPLAGRTVLDYGCGSGLLAVAALKLGARRAVAVDIDPQALQATQDNARVNGVAARLTVEDAARFRPRAFDVVVANILAQPLIELAPRLTGCLAPGGRIALAGLLDRQAAAVRAAYAGAVTFDAPARRGGWTRVAGRRMRHKKIARKS
ncbi:MAG TPA: 50S ribosomal protein L11 methyltransferase [Candidatus Binatia bacterium]|nr:50S ribosomal protein L11 methyltransferase [Candidatus Binatia bacterium]